MPDVRLADPPVQIAVACGSPLPSVICRPLVDERSNRVRGPIERSSLLTSQVIDLTLLALGGYGEKVSHELPKLSLRVRFPLPAPVSSKIRNQSAAALGILATSAWHLTIQVVGNIQTHVPSQWLPHVNRSTDDPSPCSGFKVPTSRACRGARAHETGPARRSRGHRRASPKDDAPKRPRSDQPIPMLLRLRRRA